MQQKIYVIIALEQLFPVLMPFDDKMYKEDLFS